MTFFFFFFLNDPAPTEIYTLSLHDALPISGHRSMGEVSTEAAEQSLCRTSHIRTCTLRSCVRVRRRWILRRRSVRRDRKSTRLNSSHGYISYAVFCLKKKKNNI